jgi:hypothetical protein
MMTMHLLLGLSLAVLLYSLFQGKDNDNDDDDDDYRNGPPFAAA